MRRGSSQAGAGLVMVIGVIAALAIMGTTLVAVTGNVQSNTAAERTRSKAFDVAEGALDYYMSQLARAWPKGTTTAPTFDATAFRALSVYATAAEYPNPASGLGPFASVAIYDDDQTVGGTPNVGYNPATSPHSDANNNKMVWLVARGATGAQASSIQAKVNRNPVNTSFPTGIVVYAGGNLTSNGGGNNPKIVIEKADTGVNGMVKGSIDTTTVFQTGIGVVQGNVVPTFDSLYGQVISNVVELSQTLDPSRYFDTTQGATIPSDISGICVIRVPDGSTVSIGNNGTINSLTSPGILIILGPEGGSGNAIEVDMGGNCDFWGVLLTEGRFKSSHGTPIIHGMVACASNLDMKGTPDIAYNSDVIANLAAPWTLTVNLVPNTWREIRP
jgi:hypothetical protein